MKHPERALILVDKAIKSRQRFNTHFCEIKNRDAHARVAFMLDTLGLVRSEYRYHYAPRLDAILRGTGRNDLIIFTHQKHGLDFCQLTDREKWEQNADKLETSGAVKGAYILLFRLLLANPNNDLTKICSDCAVEKMLFMFKYDPKGFQNVSSQCKRCIKNRADPLASKVRRHRRKARERNAKGVLSSDIVRTHLKNQNSRCAACKTDLEIAGHHLDHIVPVSKGGANSDENTQLLCPFCNLSKGCRDWGDFLARTGYDLL